MTTQSYSAQLHPLLTKYFSMSELHQLAFDLGIEWEEMPGQTRSEKVRSFIGYADRADRLVDLIALARRERPHVDWPEPSSAGTTTSNAAASSNSGSTTYNIDARGAQIGAIGNGNEISGGVHYAGKPKEDE
ncbi:MAG: hypothetical protein H6668_19395 [Ardenticatenaceae bacterium]|nr:hypothetical protein [Ardenticatenaceae bacterium]